VSMGNPDGMITLNYTGDGAAGDVGEQTVTIYNVDMWMNGTSTSFLTDREGNEAIIAEDCFLEQRDVVNTSSHQYYDEVEGSVLADSGRGTIQGWQEIWESSFAAMENKTTIRSSRGSRGYFHLSVGSFDEYVETKDRLITYPGPEGGGQSISVERLKKDRSFSQGDNGGKIMGDVVYVWSAVRAENMHVTVEGIDVHLPVLVLNISLNDEDMAEKGISEFSMEFWISGETSFPLKTILDVEQSSEGNSTHITTVSTATAITKGTSIIEYLPGLPTFHPWVESGGAEAEEFDTTMDIVPEYMVLNVQGQNAIPEDFTAEDAIKEARAANSELDGYLDDPGAYCIFSRYENYSHEPLWRDWWNLTFHSEGRDDMVVNVSRDSLGFEFGSSGQPAKGVPAKEDITPVLSYTGAQLIFLKHEEIYDQITENEKIDVEDGSFGTEANISLPISSPTTFLPSATGVGYGYVVEHEGGEEYKSTRA
ncbi:MAG: hypothetical protein KAT70_09350, partial [Thermoplasmata archaeon]|nr:hypothetical protein [Thermoplasmata archaeon]